MLKKRVVALVEGDDVKVSVRFGASQALHVAGDVKVQRVATSTGDPYVFGSRAQPLKCGSHVHVDPRAGALNPGSPRCSFRTTGLA